MYQGCQIRSEVGNNLQSLPKGLQMKKWTMGREIGVQLTQGWDVANFLKYAPRVSKSISELGMTFNRFPKIPIGINGPWVIK